MIRGPAIFHDKFAKIMGYLRKKKVVKLKG